MLTLKHLLHKNTHFYTTTTRILSTNVQIHPNTHSQSHVAVKPDMLDVVDPYTFDLYCSFPKLTSDQIMTKVDKASNAQIEWAAMSLDDRIDICKAAIIEFQRSSKQIATDISHQMGKPYSQSLGEIKGLEERATAMVDMAKDQLSPEKTSENCTINHFPIGNVLVVAPWNYPLLTAANSVFPALLAGNSVLLKHSSQTPLTGLAFEKIFEAAGAPKGLLQNIITSHDNISNLIKSGSVDHVVFTGSVGGGRKIQKVCTEVEDKFIDCTLELGGKDAAYVAGDADPAKAAQIIVDGGLYNAGQSCCGIERVYVHKRHFREFMIEAQELCDAYVIGDPFDSKTDIGPLALPDSVSFLQAQVNQAVALGATLICGGTYFYHHTFGDNESRCFQPTLLSNCNHKMDVMTEETFGPIIAVMKVENDEEALKLMNDSKYGLTSTIITYDEERVNKMAPRLNTGTVFMNRCDYLDPTLPWSGYKQTGKGISLSKYGFGAFTHKKSYNFRKQL